MGSNFDCECLFLVLPWTREPQNLGWIKSPQHGKMEQLCTPTILVPINIFLILRRVIITLGGAGPPRRIIFLA